MDRAVDDPVRRSSGRRCSPCDDTEEEEREGEQDDTSRRGPDRRDYCGLLERSSGVSFAAANPGAGEIKSDDTTRRDYRSQSRPVKFACSA
jgi:hypothetical protein